MRERPILFSAPMVRAILEGRKTQTRRVVKLPKWAGANCIEVNERDMPLVVAEATGCLAEMPFPYGQPGDRLWVREAFADLLNTGIEHRPTPESPIQRFAYAADTPPGSYGDECRKDYGIKWQPSIHMPRWASRILLEVTAIRVERLQDISEADAQAEGAYADAACNGMFTTDGNTYTTKQDGAAGAYAELWERLHGDDAWAANPWVWVVEFKKLGAGETAGVTP